MQHSKEVIQGHVSKQWEKRLSFLKLRSPPAPVVLRLKYPRQATVCCMFMKKRFREYIFQHFEFGKQINLHSRSEILFSKKSFCCSAKQFLYLPTVGCVEHAQCRRGCQINTPFIIIKIKGTIPCFLPYFCTIKLARYFFAARILSSELFTRN